MTNNNFMISGQFDRQVAPPAPFQPLLDQGPNSFTEEIKFDGMATAGQLFTAK